MGGPQIKIDKDVLIKYYSRPEIQNAILEGAKDREVGVLYANGGFGKRPDVLLYPNDIIELVKQGVVAFNFSEEKWEDPCQLFAIDVTRGWDQKRYGRCQSIQS